MDGFIDGETPCANWSCVRSFWRLSCPWLRSPRARACTAAAAEKKLAGAAKTSFLKKCQKDAAATCDTAAAEKKIHGAAKTSFTKKCTKDAVG